MLLSFLSLTPPNCAKLDISLHSKLPKSYEIRHENTYKSSKSLVLKGPIVKMWINKKDYPINIVHYINYEW